jgi:hypothetical protein
MILAMVFDLPRLAVAAGFQLSQIAQPAPHQQPWNASMPAAAAIGLPATAVRR